jgi:GH15 family glucan-1,4-alpha-glucosidase
LISGTFLICLAYFILKERKPSYNHIGEYGVIGDCKTVALIHKRGSIDFLCYPHYDSPSVFAKLLDKEKGGFFNIIPKGDGFTTKQHYIKSTAILITRFFSENATIEFIDFMPNPENLEASSEIIRVVKAIRGDSAFGLNLSIKYDYGRATHKVNPCSQYHVVFPCDGQDCISLALKSNIPLALKEDESEMDFSLKEGEVAIFQFEEHKSKETHSWAPDDLKKETQKKLSKTKHFWEKWIKTSNYTGDWRNYVERSVITLKLLTSSKYGSTIAAATFSLPEHVGGEKNWDYRYTWIRDAAFTMYAFIRLGFLTEASRFVTWIYDQIESEVEKQVELQIMYRYHGTADLTESTLDHWEGYKGSRPVRIGNAATEQLQLDIYGELMDTIYLFDKYGEPIDYNFWQKIVKMIDFVCKNWNKKDHGIWEVREFKKEYLYSRMMCWVALDRAIRLTVKRSFPGKKVWKKNRDLIFEDIYKNFWDEELQSFVHYKGAKTVDASLLMMPLVRIISPYDLKWKKTLKVIEENLMSDVLVYRNLGNSYPDQKSTKNNEGTFLIAAFWYIECLSRGGQVEKANHYFEKLLGYGNHLGLFAEEVNLAAEQLGNFPQAFTHLGLISTAFSLDRTSKKKALKEIEPYKMF